MLSTQHHSLFRTRYCQLRECGGTQWDPLPMVLRQLILSHWQSRYFASELYHRIGYPAGGRRHRVPLALYLQQMRDQLQIATKQCLRWHPMTPTTMHYHHKNYRIRRRRSSWNHYLSLARNVLNSCLLLVSQSSLARVTTSNHCASIARMVIISSCLFVNYKRHLWLSTQEI